MIDKTAGQPVHSMPGKSAKASSVVAMRTANVKAVGEEAEIAEVVTPSEVATVYRCDTLQDKGAWRQRGQVESSPARIAEYDQA